MTPLTLSLRRPRGRARAVRLAGAIVAVAVLAAGCGRGGDDASAATTTLPDVSDGLPLTQLEHLLITRVPEGFSMVPDERGETGPTDLAAAVRHQGGTPSVRTFFEENQFTGGYQRLWTNATRHELVVFLYQYASAGGAQAQSREIERSIRANEDSSRLRSFVPDVPGGVGLLAPQGNLWIAAVLFSKGHYWGMVRLAAPDVDGARAQATTLARDQYQRLP